MALSQAEQQEMNQLESEVGSGTPSSSGNTLSPSEQAEMAGLEKEVGDAVPGGAPTIGSNQTPDQIMAANAKRLDDSGIAANNSLADTLTLGYLPQIKAKAGQIFSGEGISNDKNYLSRRDQAIKEQQALAAQYPGATAEGKIAGFVAPLALTGGASGVEEIPAALAESAPELTGEIAKQGVLKAATKGAVKGAAIGAGMGLAQNPGDTENQVNPLQFSQRLNNAKTGAEFGAAIGAPLGAIPNAADYLSSLAEKKAIKGAGGMLKDFRKEYANDSTADTGRFILDNGLVTAGDTYESTAQKASQMRDATGQQLGNGYDAATQIVQKLNPADAAKVDQAGFNPVRDKQAIMDAAKQDIGYSYNRKSALQGLSDYLDGLGEEHGDQTLNPATTNQIKTALDKSAINWERNPLLRQPDAEAALKTFRGYLSNKVNGQIQAVGDVIGDPNAAQTLSDLNSKYGMAAKVARMAGDRAQRDAANAAFGLKEFAGAELGGDIGHELAGRPGRIVGTVVGGVGGHVARKIGPSISAGATDALASGLENIGNPTATQLVNPALYSAAIGKNDSESQLNQPAGPSGQPDLSPAKAPAVPLKGQDKWASDGLQKLIQHSGDQSLSTLKDDPKAKNLFIAASDLNPGTKAMANLYQKLKAIKGNQQ